MSLLAITLKHQAKEAIKHGLHSQLRFSWLERSPPGKARYFMPAFSAEWRVIGEQNPSQQFTLQQASERRVGAKPDGKENIENLPFKKPQPRADATFCC